MDSARTKDTSRVEGCGWGGGAAATLGMMSATT